MEDNQNQSEPQKKPFIIKCISDDCTVVHAGIKTYKVGELDDEIAKNTDFGRKLKEARDEVAQL